MAELLLELLTEEIPARMQSRAAEDLRRLIGERLAAAGLVCSVLDAFATPRRLALVAAGLPASQPDAVEERKGPRQGAPEAALQGFLRSAGLASIAQCETRDTGKGVFYFAVIRRAGRPTAEILPEILRAAILALPWPRSMRFPAASFRWVRPLASVLCLFAGEVLPLALDRVPVGATTRGHRFLAPESFAVRDFVDYRTKLAAAHVVLDAAERRRRIAEDLAAAAQEAGVAVKEDEGLLDEVTGLVELPVVLMGAIDAAFMALPPEVLTTSMRTHQKYFTCIDGEGRLAPRFLMVANTAAPDGGRTIVAGNERVLRARLSDAQFFWEQDRKAPLASRLPKLAERIFHARLGTMEDKVARIQALSDAIRPFVPGAERNGVGRAATLAKADLSTGMVGEFPELQGVMGRYYALNDGEDPAVADAVAEHYSPLGPGDRCPSAPTAVAVALADKLDTLVGFFAIGEVPTGSKDPFALRRAALGVIRLVLENRLRLPLARILDAAARLHAEGGKVAPGAAVTGELLDFFADRLKVHLREQGVRHDLVAAVFAPGGEDDLVRLLARVAALEAFLASEDGANLLTAYRRASNIVRIEERKDGMAHDAAPDPARFETREERALAERLETVRRASAEALRREAFAEAMASLAGLRAAVDEFFDRVTVNTAEAELRANRLRLLSRIRDTLNEVADFARIEG